MTFTGNGFVDFLVLLVFLDITEIVNINGWGGKRKNLVGEDLP